MSRKSTFTNTNQSNPSGPLFPTFQAIPQKLMGSLRGLGRGWKKSWHYLLGIAIVLVFVYAALDIYATAQLNHQLNLVRQQGAPLSMEEAAPPQVPNAQNAAIWYERAAKALIKDGRYIPAKLPPEKAAALVAKNKKALDLVKEATTKQKYRSKTDWSSGQSIVYSGMSQMRSLTRLLSMQAQYEAERGNTQAALDIVRQQFIMARHLSTEPVLIGALVARALEYLANDTLAKVLSLSSINAKEAHRFQASLEQIDWDTVLYRALLTERAFMMEAFRNGWDTNSKSIESLPQPFITILRYITKPLRKLDETHSLRLWQEILKDIKNTPVPMPLNHGQDMDKKIEQSPWYALTTKSTLPLFTRQRRIIDGLEVERRQREIALALAVYHTEYHQYPATLREAELLWKSTFPLDPYSQKPFHYKNDGNSYLLYSVGENRTDDKGVNNSYKNHITRLRDDLVWKN